MADIDNRSILPESISQERLLSVRFALGELTDTVRSQQVNLCLMPESGQKVNENVEKRHFRSGVTKLIGANVHSPAHNSHARSFRRRLAGGRDSTTRLKSFPCVEADEPNIIVWPKITIPVVANHTCPHPTTKRPEDKKARSVVLRTLMLVL